MTERVGVDTESASAAFAVSPAGILTYWTRVPSRRQLTWFSRSNQLLGTIGPADETLSDPALSPDGQRVAVWRTVQGSSDVWLFDAQRVQRFTTGGSEMFPTWSRDGKRIVFDSNRAGARNLYEKTLNSSEGSEEPLFQSSQLQVANDWSRDGRSILYFTFDEKTSGDLWIQPHDGDRRPYKFAASRFNEGAGQFSPDGRWVAYQSDESGRYEIYVQPFPGPGAARPISTTGGVQARWRHDGRELFYVAPDRTLMAVPVAVSGDALVASAPMPLFKTRIWGVVPFVYRRQQYDVAPDGRFLINVESEDTNGRPITVVLNWTAALKK